MIKNTTLLQGFKNDFFFFNLTSRMSKCLFFIKEKYNISLFLWLSDTVYSPKLKRIVQEINKYCASTIYLI